MSVSPRWLSLAFVLALACGNPVRMPDYAPGSGNPELLTTEDTGVYDVVLSARDAIFETQPAPGPPPGVAPAPESERPPAPVQLRPSTDRGTAAEIEGLRWRDLDGRPLPAPFDVPEGALRDFRERNRQRASLARYEPRHLAIELVERAPALTPVYSLTLPGYSADRTLAVVEFSVGTSGLSGGGMLVVLRKADGVWRVVAKHPTWIS